MPDLDVPRIGKYEIQADLGQGGFGKVYRAFDPTVGRAVALKILTAEGNPDLLTRFRNEATAAGKLNHRNIVTVYEFGEHNGRPYLVMELLEGQDLVQVIKDGAKLSLLQKMNIMDQVADGLDCAHRNGIIHRDIKPGNIRLLPDGTVKIMDFGVARMNRERDETRLTQQGDLIGTILYMSPEQFSGGVADVLTDVFAYGVTYYELLTGEHPFKSTDPARVMFKISMEEPKPLRSLIPDCPEGLEQIINRAIQKDREMRYQGLGDLRLDTEPLLFEMEQERARTLAVEAHRVFDSGDLPGALTIVHEALALDPSNRDVRQLREAVQKELQRQTLQARLQVILQTAEEQLGRREFAAAIQTLESALKLDQTNERTRALLEAARADLQRFKDAARLAASALVDLRKKDLAGAYEKASEAARLDPLNKDAEHVLGEVRVRKSILDRLAEIDVLRDEGNWDSALQELRELAALHPNSREIKGFLDETLSRQAAAQAIDAARLQAQEFIGQSRFGDAKEHLSAVLRDFPDHPGLLSLLAKAQDGLAALERARAITQIVDAGESLKNEANFDGALEELDRALLQFPGESRLVELRSAVAGAKADRERERFIQNVVQRSNDLRNNLQLSEALQLVQSALTRYQQDPTLVQLDAELRHAIDVQAQKKKQAIENVARQAQARTKREDFRGALQILDKALESWPGEARILEALQATKEAEKQQTARRERAAAIAQHLQEGQRLLDQSQTSQAIQLLEKACAEFPEAAELQRLLAKARERQQGVDRAEREAQAAVERQEFDRALQVLESVRGSWPGETRLDQLAKSTESARAAHERKQLARRQRAEAIAQKLTEGQRLLSQGQTAQAVTALEASSKQFPESAELQALLKQARQQQEAIAQAEREAELARQRAAAIAQYLQEGQRLLDQSQTAQAIQLVEKACAEFPEAADLQRLLAKARERQQGVDRAEREAQAAIQQQDFDRALQVLESVRGLWPGETLLDQLAKTAEAARAAHEREQLARRQRAEAIAQKLTEGQRLLSQGQTAQAVTALEASSKQYPESAELQGLLKQARQQQEAIAQAEREAELARQRAAAIAQRLQEGQRLLDQSQTAQAIQLLEKACGEFPEAAELQRLLAKARERQQGVDRAEREAQAAIQQQDFDRALQVLESARGSWPGDKRLDQALKTTEAARAAHEREQLARRQRAEAIAQKLTEGQRLLSQGQTAQAVAALEASSKQYSESAELQALLKQARQQQEAIAQAERESHRRIDRRDFQRALEILNQAVRSWPAEARLQQLLQAAIAGQAAIAAQDRQLAIETVIRDANRLAAKGRFPQALTLIRSAQQTYQQEPLIQELERHILQQQRRAKSDPSPATEPSAGLKVPAVLQSRGTLAALSGVVLLAAGLIGVRALRSGRAVALAITSNVAGASVLVGDKSCAVPGCSLSLPAGTYHLSATKDGFQPLSQTIVVRQGDSLLQVPLAFDPLPQLVQVNTNFTNGQVFLDGHSAGVLRDGQFSLSGVSPGPHALRITSGEAQFETQWRNAVGSSPELQRPFTARNVQATVIANLGQVGSVVCDCDASTIKLDGAVLHATDAGTKGIQLADLKEGTRKISIGDRSMVVDLKPNPALTVFLALDKDIGTLVVQSNEAGAKLYINGRLYHRSTDRGSLRIPLDIGHYTVRVEKNGFAAAAEQTVDLAKGEDKQLAFTLSPVPPSLQITGALPGAQVKVDGRVVGETDANGAFRTEVAAGNHAIDLTKQDYTDARFSGNFAPGATIRPDRTQLAMARVVKPAPAPVVTPAPAPAAVESKPTEAQDWDRVRNSSNPDELEDFIRKHPGGAYITDARNRLSQVRAQMDAAAARQAEQTAWNRLDKTNKADLQDFLSRYGTGPHAPDARSLITGIDNQQAEKEKQQEEANRALADAQSITRTLSAYETAYNAKDIKSLESVWQEMPKNMVEATRREFGDSKTISFQIRPLDKPAINGNSATVNCTRTLTLTLKQGGRQQMAGERVKVALSRANSGWLIQSITPY